MLTRETKLGDFKRQLRSCRAIFSQAISKANMGKFAKNKKRQKP